MAKWVTTENMAENTGQCVIQNNISRCKQIIIEPFDIKPGRAIVPATARFASGKHWDKFPPLVWQAKAGAQANMNANEWIANRAHEIAGQPLGMMAPGRPTDHTIKQSTVGRKK